jgi:hypothetical protein
MMPACMGKLRNAFKLGLAATLACGVFLRPATAGTTALPFAMVQATPGDYVRVGATAEATAANLDGIANSSSAATPSLSSTRVAAWPTVTAYAPPFTPPRRCRFATSS